MCAIVHIVLYSTCGYLVQLHFHELPPVHSRAVSQVWMLSCVFRIEVSILLGCQMIICAHGYEKTQGVVHWRNVLSELGFRTHLAPETEIISCWM